MRLVWLIIYVVSLLGIAIYVVSEAFYPHGEDLTGLPSWVAFYREYNFVFVLLATLLIGVGGLLGATRSIRPLRVAIFRLLRRWNYGDKPMVGWTLLLLWIFFGVWVASSWVMWTQFTASHRAWSMDFSNAVLVGYGWVGFGGLIGTASFAEFNRWLYSHSAFHQVSSPAEPRGAPRIEPIVTGFIERILFTTVAIILVQVNALAALGGVSAGYVALKVFKRMVESDRQVSSTLPSIWGTGLSLGFAILGGWLFNQLN